MVTFKAYPTKKSVPSRMSRKHARITTFLYNKTNSKRLKSEQRRHRRALSESEE